MLLELWILLAVLAGGAIGGVVVRLRRKRVREAPTSESNVYPLW